MKERTSHFALDSDTSGVLTLQSSAGLLVSVAVASGALNYAYALVLSWLLPTSSYSVFLSNLTFLLMIGTVAIAAMQWILAKELHGIGSGLAERTSVFERIATIVSLGLIATGSSGLLTSRFLHKWSLISMAVGPYGLFAALTGMGWTFRRRQFRLLTAIAMGIAIPEFGCEALP